MPTTPPPALLVMAPSTLSVQFGPHHLDRLRTAVQLHDPAVVAGFDEAPHFLAATEVLLTSWGCPPITHEVLDAAPRLRAIVHAAGSVRGLVPPDIHERGIEVTTAAHLNAVPVAEFTLASIIFAGKRALPLAELGRANPAGWEQSFTAQNLSNLGRTIGIVGFSRIGQEVLTRLPMLDTAAVLVADPFADPAEVAAAGGTLLPLEEVLDRSDILSLHAPLLPATAGMIGTAELARLPDGATIINTARGGLIDHDALTRECRTGRLDAILDVTDPEPLPAGHPLLALPNVTITPHLAGSLGSETMRLADFAVDAVVSYAAGRPLPGALTLEASEVSA
ncbi:MAG TPA: hydroxyacid dehydrogenase [Actinomycetaceae bacterium]|nr:hydroxyacid dehydrogenase [Actinomycetaceae bacterium]